MAKTKRPGGLPAYGTWVRLPDGSTGRVSYHNRREGNIEIAIDGKRAGTIGVEFGVKLVRIGRLLKERETRRKRSPRRPLVPVTRIEQLHAEAAAAGDALMVACCTLALHQLGTIGVDYPLDADVMMRARHQWPTATAARAECVRVIHENDRKREVADHD